MIRRRGLRCRWSSRWLVRWNIWGPTASTALCCTGQHRATGWTDADAEVWEAMQKERDAGRTRLLGVSNVSVRHVEQMIEVHSEAPTFVQNRCYARLGWDREVRKFCREHKIIYQGFSLLTANVEALWHPVASGMAAGAKATPAQVVFAFARAMGMLSLTGTSSAEHMREDLASCQLELESDAVWAIESLVG